MKKLTLTTLLLCLLFVSQSCTDILSEVEPSDAKTPDVILSNPDQIKALRANMYDTFHGFDFTTRYFLAPAALADNSDIFPGASRFASLNQNRGSNGIRDGLNDGTYETVYDLILTANLIINSIPEGTLDPEVKALFVGEALVFRALAMHHLVRVLGYEPGMVPSNGPGAGFNLGIIVRTEAVQSTEDIKILPRNTVSEVYDQIIADLERAIPLLPAFDKYYVNKAFAQGLLARVYLYAGQYELADDFATQAIATSGLSLASDPETVKGLFNETTANHPTALLVIATDPATEQVGGAAVNNSPNVYTSTQWMSQIPTQSLLKLYPPDDYRWDWYEPCFNDAESSSEVESCKSVNDKGVESRKWHGENGQFTDDYPLMRVAELKLIQAEARYRTSGVAAGLIPLNELRAARGLDPLLPTELSLGPVQQNVNPGLEPFIAEILKARRRELCFEGHRFYDLKRLGLNIPDPAGEIKISYTSHKILDNIASSEIETNKELVQNPGY